MTNATTGQGNAQPGSAVPRHDMTSARACHTRFGVFPECPLCGGGLTPEHAHFKCFSCGWRDSCCD